MRLSQSYKQWISIGLCVLLLLLGVAGSVHSATHIGEDKSITHQCTLCFHKSQLAHALHSNILTVAVVKQQFVTGFIPAYQYPLIQIVAYNSRAPPAIA